MTPAEHYREAEKLLNAAAQVASGKQKVTRDQAQVVNESLLAAQVHASLAAVDKTVSLEAARL